MSDEVRELETVHGRRYLRCLSCDLRFMAPQERPSAEQERAHYRRHENDPADPGYRAFLARLGDPLVARLAPGSFGLDYGSGPGPTLSVMLAERGFATAIYDPFFAPDESVLRRQYDFITCTETVEHFHDPRREFERFDRLLRPGGWLGVMTELSLGDERFARWWYVRDPTHVCFYSLATMCWIARQWNWQMEQPGRTVVLFRKQ